LYDPFGGAEGFFEGPGDIIDGYFGDNAGGIGPQANSGIGNTRQQVHGHPCDNEPPQNHDGNGEDEGANLSPDG
jgi:hypothetical protein